MTYGFCYDNTGSRCSGRAQPGVRIFRDTMDELIPALGDFGIYNCRPKRTSSSLSLHGEGRAWDAACTGKLLIDMGQFCVDAAQDLGIQRVICGFGVGKPAKEWDSRPGERAWEDYDGPAHDDHCHIEFCWKSALHLTAAQVRAAYLKYWKNGGFLMALSDEEQKKLLEYSYKSYKALFNIKDGKEINLIDVILQRLDAIEAKP